jgi:pectinesterase
MHLGTILKSYKTRVYKLETNTMNARTRYGLLAALCLCSIISITASAVSSTSTRPQLTSTQAATYTKATYLAQAGTLGSLSTDNWSPTGVAAASTFTATYAVASDGTASYTKIQSAINAAVSAGGSSRVYISVKAGTYTEIVCIPASAPPITLYGLDTTASNTTITYNNANLTPKSAGTATSSCIGNASATTVGTLGSATATVLASGFNTRNLTFKNSYVEGTYSGSNQSAVALALRGDKAILHNVRVLGNQDTLYIGASSSTTVIRAYIYSSFIQGDTDFIFGHGTAVFDTSTIQYTGARLGSGVASYMFAPSTRPANTYGFLVLSSTLNYTGSVSSSSIYLGRAWDESVGSLSNYVNGSSPNGQVVIRDSALSAHIRLSAPWGASTISRPYCSSSCTYSANRFYEYNNSGDGSGN